MSFLARNTFRSVRTAHITTSRAFSTSLVQQKTATDTVKDTVKGVDRKVSDKIVDGIELGREFFLASPVQLFSFIVLLFS